MIHNPKYDPGAAGIILKAGHRPYPSPTLPKAALDDMGGPCLFPNLFRPVYGLESKHHFGPE